MKKWINLLRRVLIVFLTITMIMGSLHANAFSIINNSDRSVFFELKTSNSTQYCFLNGNGALRLDAITRADNIQVNDFDCIDHARDITAGGSDISCLDTRSTIGKNISNSAFVFEETHDTTYTCKEL